MCNFSWPMTMIVSISNAWIAWLTKVYRALGSSFLVPRVGTVNAAGVSRKRPEMFAAECLYKISFQAIQWWHIPILSFSHLIPQASAMCSTRTRHTSAFLFVGSRAPSHQLAVSTSPEIVLAAVEAGGEPNG